MTERSGSRGAETAEEKRLRLAQALRANLRRRKAQARARAEAAPEAHDDSAPNSQD